MRILQFVDEKTAFMHDDVPEKPSPIRFQGESIELGILASSSKSYLRRFV
jgi:hypothetical protein